MGMKEKTIKGINILNPVDLERDYYLHAIDYAIENDYNHIQLNGPIHNLVKSNLDGMMFYRKYSRFNDEKDADYVNTCMQIVNEGLERSHRAGIKTFMWHHELEIPNGFNAAFPEVLNEYGDVEVSHPRIKDFLENKIRDFFAAYPLMDGFVLTYYETKVPLLRLKKQKLTTNEIMTYVTKILHDTCKSLGKQVIVRTNTPTEEDYRVLLKAYEQVATDDLMIMEKWTQFDWSLALPNNYFIRNIKHNPLLIETDIFGEFFGKGKLPLMLKDHIQEKVAYCEQFDPVGYCSRIDRGGYSAFGTVNEVNLHIMKALLNGYDLEQTISQFFDDRYGAAGAAVKAVMEQTESIVRRMLYANGYYYSELSWFPSLNHSKNHFYFELMRENCSIASNEWFIPVNYERGDVQNIFDDLSGAKTDAEAALREIEKLEGTMDPLLYKDLYTDFKNLQLATGCWIQLANVFYSYVRYFDEKNPVHEENLQKALDTLRKLDAEGKAALGKDYYCNYADVHAERHWNENILMFIDEVQESFAYEKKKVQELDAEALTDYIVCGGGSEGHDLKKEVNFSDTVMIDGELARICGNKAGMKWSTIAAHGWFSYELKIRENQSNTIRITAGSATDTLKLKVTIGEREFLIDQPNEGKNELVFDYQAQAGETSVRVRIDKISANVPLAYLIRTC